MKCPECGAELTKIKKTAHSLPNHIIVECKLCGYKGIIFEEVNR